MTNIFIHDAVPTWSGFIYQGEIAIYLAVKKICDLKEVGNGNSEEVNFKNYEIEVENCEDIAIVYNHDNVKKYISIHQVKNQKDKTVTSYRSPLIQLMLENGFYRKRGCGTPKAYLHVSNNTTEEIDVYLASWQQEILDYYNYLKNIIGEIDKKGEEVYEEICENIKNEPIKMNRTEYRKLKEDIMIKCNKKSSEVLNSLRNLIEFLEEELSVSNIETNVETYTYKNGNKYIKGIKVFNEIVDEVKRYKKNSDKISQTQYEYIANMLLDSMRKHILKRHELKQQKKTYEHSISLNEIYIILENKLECSEENENILSLRRLYNQHLCTYCTTVCTLNCEEVKECKLKKNEFTKMNLSDDEFKRLCYSFNPDCGKVISDRDCLASLLNHDGLHESVFEVLTKVHEKYFVENGSNNTKFVIDNGNTNAFLTAISNKNSCEVVQDIIEGIQNNADLVSKIFEADQLITTRLNENVSVWDSDYTEIQAQYSSIILEDNQNSICMPKKPEFISAEEVIKKLVKN